MKDKMTEVAERVVEAISITGLRPFWTWAKEPFRAEASCGVAELCALYLLSLKPLTLPSTYIFKCL